MRSDEILLVYFVLMCIIATASVVLERDVLKAIAKSAVQSLALVLVLALLQAPEIVLVYLPIGVGAYTILFINVLMRTPRHERESRGDSRLQPLALGISTMALILILVAVIVYHDVVGGSPSENIKSLGNFYLRTAYNSTAQAWWSREHRAVVSIVWDYRGVDTLFELVVFFLGITASVALLKFLKARKEDAELSMLVKSATKLISSMIVIISLALLLAKHIAGGGFQSGATLAIASAILASAYRGIYLEQLGFRDWKLTVGIISGLLGVALVALLPALLGGMALQNQAKPWTEFRGYSIDLRYIHIASSIELYDILEAIAVASGFSLAFLLLLAPREVFVRIHRRLIGGD